MTLWTKLSKEALWTPPELSSCTMYLPHGGVVGIAGFWPAAIVCRQQSQQHVTQNWTMASLQLVRHRKWRGLLDGGKFVENRWHVLIVTMH